METKKCLKCRRELRQREFYKNSRNKDGLQSYCKKCHIEINKAYYKKFREDSQILPPPKKNGDAAHPVFSKMLPREIIAEIKERANFLRSTGWEVEAKLRYVKVNEISI